MKLKINLKLINFLFFTLFIFISKDTFAKSKIEEIFKSNSEIEDPMGLRDPFLAPRFKSKRDNRIKGKVAKGVYSNIPQIGEVKLESLKVIGVVIGPNRRAFAKIGEGGSVYVLKEGMKLGQNKAVLRAILPGGLVLVEKNTNIYGEDEYLETVIPISK